MSQHAILSLNNICKDYDAGSDVGRVQVLNNLSFEAFAGETAAVIGPSGSGKTTLLNIIGTLDRPTSGSIKLDADDLTQADDAALTRIRNRKIGFIFQLHHLLPQCSVLENVLVPTLVDRPALTPDEAEERAMHLLNRVGLSDRVHHRPGQLSGGERQRAAFVRALINKPSLVLADEPTGALDQANAERLTELLVELNREENVTLLMVTHALDLAKAMQRVYRLQDGKLVDGLS